MQAIRTVYLSATERSGARVKATAAAGSVTLPYDHSLRHDLEANHRLAAEALVTKMGWNADGYGNLISGCLPDGSYCHVMSGRDGKGG